RPCVIDTHGVDLPGAIRLDARFLYNQISHSNSVNGTLFSTFPAFQQYMLHQYMIDIHGVAQLYGLGLSLALSDSMPDSSRTRHPIPFLSMGYCSAASQLHNGVRYVPVRWIPMELTYLALLDSMPDSSTTRYLI